MSSGVYVSGQEPKQNVSPGGPIRVSVDRVNISVAVTDSHGRFFKGLRREDFRVFDNDIEQPITGFAPSKEPTRLVFLIESSMADDLLTKLGKSPLLSADNLLNDISAINQVAIVTYSDGPHLTLDFTSDKLQARMMLEGMNSQILSPNPKADSGWLNLSSSLVTTVDWLSTVPGSKTILLFSTGIDTSPPDKWRVAEEKLKTTDVRVLALSMMGDFRSLGKNRSHSQDVREDRVYLKQGMAQFDESLRDLSAATGGHAYFPKNAKEFERAYSEISELVRGEYTLEFVPRALDGLFHSLRVKVNRASCHADYRPGYFAPARTSP